MSGVVIRPAHAGDLPSLDGVEKSANLAFDGIDLKAPEAPAAPFSNLWVHAMSSGTLWVAEDPDAGVVGLLAAEIVDGGLHIEELDVAFEWQRQGLGRRLLQGAIDWARDHGLTSASLTTYRSVPFNAPFYASLGFAELAPVEAPPWLAAILAAEFARGLDGRCAMRLAL